MVRSVCASWFALPRRKSHSSGTVETGDNLIADIEGEIDERAGEQRFQIRRDVVILFQLIRQRIHQAGDICQGAFDGQLMIDGGEIAVRRDIVRSR